MDTKKFETPGDKSCSTHISDHCIGWSVLQCINNYSVFDGRIKFLIMSKNRFMQGNGTSDNIALFEKECQQLLDSACRSIPFLFMYGFVITYSGLLIKL